MGRRCNTRHDAVIGRPVSATQFSNWHTSLAVIVLVGVVGACGPSTDQPSSADRAAVATLSPDQACARDRGLLTTAAATYATIVGQVETQRLTAREGASALGQVFLDLYVADMAECVKAGQDALTSALAARKNAYEHYTDGKTAQAAADLQEENVYLVRYEAWRTAQAAATPRPTPSGATSSSTASSWSVVKVWEGNGADVAITQTEPFTVGGEWRIDYDNRGAYLGIDIYDAAAKAKIPGFVWFEKPGTDTTFFHRAGTYYLAISAAGLWKIDVQDGK